MEDTSHFSLWQLSGCPRSCHTPGTPSGIPGRHLGSHGSPYTPSAYAWNLCLRVPPPAPAAEGGDPSLHMAAAPVAVPIVVIHPAPPSNPRSAPQQARPQLGRNTVYRGFNPFPSSFVCWRTFQMPPPPTSCSIITSAGDFSSDHGNCYPV